MKYPPERVRWACRRGMLELDHLLIPFFDARYKGLSLDLQKDFIALLDESDQDIYAWLLHQEPPLALKLICEQIREFHQSAYDTSIAD